MLINHHSLKSLIEGDHVKDVDLLIYDEASNLKNDATHMHKAITQLNCTKVLLSGTPMQNNIYEFYHLLSIVSNKLGDFESFKKEYGLVITKRCLSDATAEEKLRKNEVVYVLCQQMSDCFHRQDATILKQYVTELREYKITYHLNPACEYVTDGLGALAQHSLSAEVCEKQKVSFAASVIGIASNGCSTEDPNKVVVFSKFIKCLDLLFSACSMLYECNIVKGDTSQVDRCTRIESFKNHNGFAVLFMTIGVGALGINLQCANYILLLEPNWNWSIEEQAVARSFRMGQKRDVTCLRFSCRDTIEKAMKNIHIQKKVD